MNVLAAVSTIIAGLALIASFLGVWFAFKTMKHQRIHDVKSVIPIVHVGQWDYENDLCVTLKNCGMGLAIVKRMWAKHRYTDEIRNNIYEWLPSKLEANVNYSKYWTPHSEFIIQAGESIDLIKIPIDDKIADQIKVREFLRREIGSLIVELEYSDVYGNKMPLKTMELTWFTRRDNVNKSLLITA
jgi:hypothetical protein